jgi:Pro-kumamolisin, activation domain/Bacterial Ig-like domain (group 3)
LSRFVKKVLAAPFVFFVLVLAPAAFSQSAPDTPSPLAEESYIQLPSSAHYVTRQAMDLGRVEPSRRFDRMLLVLSPSAHKEADLATLLEQQQNPSSPNHHHWLTPEEFGARFGPEAADLQRAQNWLQSAGFTVSAVAKGGRWIEFGGTAAQVESAFRTEMHSYQLAGQHYVANATDISLPVSIAQISRGPVSLNNFPKRPPTQRIEGFAGIDAQGHKIKLTPNLTAVGNSNTFYLSPGDFGAIYNTKPLLGSGNDGSGISIVVTAQSQIELTDVESFRQIFSLKANDPNIYLSGPDPGIANSIDQQEATLDVEWAGAVAPGATIDLVIAGSTDSTNGVDLAAAYAIDNQIAPILTYTYGSCEQSLQTSGNAFYNALWQQAAAEGITVLVAAGDNGSANCDSDSAGLAASQGLSVNGAASTPFNVAVGGTQFNDSAAPATYWNANNNAAYSSAVGYIPEAAWNESCDPAQSAGPTNCLFSSNNFSTLSGGGGASTVYSKPSWQTGTNVPADGARDIPDVALAAASGHDDLVYCNSQGGTACQINAQNQVVGLTLIGGTSASTPAMAGILALVEQKNGAFQGQINYTLYKLAQNSGASCNSSTQTNPSVQNSCLFYDVTTGNNAVPCAGGSLNCSSAQAGTDGFLTGQSAGPGYDLATGLGSVNANNLANNWTSATLLPSQTQLQVPTTTFVHGTVILISGSVAPASGNGTPTGAIALKTSTYGNADTVPLNSGSFSSSNVSDLPGGSYNLSAHYGGDATYGVSDSIPVAVSVSPENSTTTLTASGLQAGGTPYGDPVEFVVRVQGLSGAGIATGSITLQDTAAFTTIGTYPLASDGSAHIFTGLGSSYSFSVGSHGLTASYSGDNSFNTSNSTAVPFTIGKNIPLVIVGVNSATVSTTQPIGAHVEVSGYGNAAATGTVQFTVDGVLCGSVIPLATGGFFGTQAQASALISGLPKGTHVIGANYNGSADPSYSSVANGDPQYEPNEPVVTVSSTAGTSTTTTLTPVTLPLNIGDTGTFKVNVSPATSTGTVTLWDAVGPRTSSVTMTGATATIQFPWTQAGTTSLYAVYSGDANNAASSSPAAIFTVKQGATQVVVSAPAQITSDQQVSIVASVTGLSSDGKAAGANLANPSGSVQFWDSLNGAAAELLSTQTLTVGAGHIGTFGLRTKLPVGSNTITVQYLGDTNWLPGSSSNFTVNSTQSPDFTVTESPNPAPVAAGSAGTATIIITPTGGFTGPVVLACPTGSFPIAGYTCGFTPSSTVTISNANVGSATLNLTPSAAAGNAVAAISVDAIHPRRGFASLSLFTGILLLVLMAYGSDSSSSMRPLEFAAGCVLCVASLVMGCGGGSGGGGGGGKVNSTTTLTSSNLRITYQAPLIFTVKITANSTPSGTAELIDNGQIYSSGPVSAGIATFQTTTLPVGVHVITAQYSGDSSTLASTSAPITQIVTGPVPIGITATSGSTSHTVNFTVQIN